MKNICFLILSICFLNMGCIDEIKLKIDGAQQNIFVDGLIGDSLQVYEIKVNYSAVIGAGSDYVHEPVLGASVRVLDDAGQVYEFEEVKDGYFEKEMQGEAGKAYHVEVTVPDGRVLKSVPVVMLSAPPIDRIEASVLEEGFVNSAGNISDRTLMELRLNTSVKNSEIKPFLRWRVRGEYEFKESYPMALNPLTCYVQNRIDVNNLRIFDTRSLGDGVLKDELFFQMGYDYKFAYNYAFHVQQYAMGEAEFSYWQTVQDIVDIDGNLFDPPPGTVRGNIYNESDPEEIVLGYFSVVGISNKIKFINSTMTRVSVEPRCRPFRPGPRPSECSDCLEIKNSTLQEPPYWP